MSGMRDRRDESIGENEEQGIATGHAVASLRDCFQ
jgi:hypothetical protein